MGNQLIYAQGYVWRDGKLVERLGSAGVRRFDGRLGLFRIADEALAWAQREGHDAYQLRKLDPVISFQRTRAVGCVMVLRREAEAKEAAR